MKKISLILLAMFSLNWANAQIEKGSMYLGGTFLISSTTFQEDGDDDKISSFSILPNFGYFVSDKLSIGLQAGYTQEKEKNVNGVNSSTNTSGLFLVAPTLRYYVPTASENFFFFAQFQVGLGFGNNKEEVRVGNTTLSTSSKASSFNLGLSPGFAFFPTKKWAIELGFQGISYNSIDPNTDSDSDNDRRSNFTLGVDSFAPRIGMQFFF
jgi:opacity protein-like surface antigen